MNAQYLRIIDANLNRAKEGFRVCEDVCRFVLDDKKSTAKLKSLRHGLTECICSLKIKSIILARDIEGDVGKKSSRAEFARRDLADVFYANLQRVKESLRVLEEVTKILNPRVAEGLKSLRYQVYAVEKKIIEKL